jgi:cobalamin biosynthesis Mg chelatase CobN
MEQIVELLKEINIAQVFVMLAGIWFFYSRLDNKMDKRFAKLEEKFERLEEKVEDVDRRLCRIEGSLATQGHCLFGQKESDRKASSQ